LPGEAGGELVGALNHPRRVDEIEIVAVPDVGGDDAPSSDERPALDPLAATPLRPGYSNLSGSSASRRRMKSVSASSTAGSSPGAT